MAPSNQKDILAAARISGKVIPVQIYLYSHYENPYGYFFNTTQQLKDLVDSLDPQLVKVVGECLVCAADDTFLVQAAILEKWSVSGWCSVSVVLFPLPTARHHHSYASCCVCACCC